MLAQTHLKQQLDALRHSTVSGFVRLRVAANVDLFPGWLAAQTLYPRIYWQARGPKSPEYVALGAIHELTRPEDIQRVCDLANTSSEDSPRYYGGLAFDPAQPGWQGFGPCRFVLPRIELVRRGECISLCLNLWLPAQDKVHEFDAELQAAEAALDALQPETPLPSLQKRSWQRRDVPGPAQWQSLVERVTDPAFQAHTPKVVLSRESLLESEESIPPPLPLVPADPVGPSRPGVLPLRLPVLPRAELHRLLPRAPLSPGAVPPLHRGTGGHHSPFRGRGDRRGPGRRAAGRQQEPAGKPAGTRRHPQPTGAAHH